MTRAGGEDEGDGGGVVAHVGAEGDEEAASAGFHDSGGEDDGCVSGGGVAWRLSHGGSWQRGCG